MKQESSKKRTFFNELSNSLSYSYKIWEMGIKELERNTKTILREYERIQLNNRDNLDISNVDMFSIPETAEELHPAAKMHWALKNIERIETVIKSHKGGENLNYSYIKIKALEEQITNKQLELRNLEQMTKNHPYNKLIDTIKDERYICAKLRIIVFMRDEFKCLKCGKTALQTDLHIDHIKPISKGGISELSNLQTLCSDCNLSKSNRNSINYRCHIKYDKSKVIK